MKSFIAIAAFAAGTNALVSRGDSCCFHLSSSGGASGSVGELGDGQVRVGDKKLSTSQFCISSTGAITDGDGRGCVITTPETQFQCDLGANATTGFSISSSGQLEYDGSADFIACETGDNGGLNFYTTNSSAVTGCKKVNLKADSCSGSGSGSGAGASSSPKSSGVPHSSAPAGPSSSPGSPSSPGSSGSPGSPSSPGGPAPSGAASSASVPNCAPLSGSPITVTSTVTVTDCNCPAGSPAPTAGQPGGGGGGAPASHTSGGAPVPSAPATHSSGAPGGESPAPSGSPAPHTSGAPGGGSAAPSGSPTPHSAPASSGTPAPSGSPQPSGPQPSGPAGGSSSTPAVSLSTSTFVATSTVAASTPGSSAAPSSTSASGTSSASGSCATTLITQNEQYQYPHLIVPVNSSSPDTAVGNGYFGTVSSTVSTIFNFDIPSSFEGSTCNLLFMFPKKADLETTDYTFSGDGKLDFTQLSEVATSDTTWNTVPSTSQNLGDITISPGNTYVVSSFSCPAGQAVAYEISEAGTTSLHWFNDWNPSPLGVFITKC